MHHNGIRGHTLKWFKDFLDKRKQAEVINGVNSNCIPVSSGVPQGSVICPILFLVYINDLQERVKSRVRLLADDLQCTLLSAHTLKARSSKLTYSALKNGKICGVWILISPNARSFKLLALKLSFETKYFLHDTNLDSVSSAVCPHTATDIQKVETVQRRAASWVLIDYNYTSSVTATLKDLNLRSLDQRRIDNRLHGNAVQCHIRLYRVTYDLLTVPASQYITHNTRLSTFI